jgi:hypothetical protein
MGYAFEFMSRMVGVLGHFIFAAFKLQVLNVTGDDYPLHKCQANTG